MRRILGLVAALLALALSGCASLPTSGPVIHHDLQHEQEEGGVEIAPEPPSPGAAPLLIVEGFLHAMATYQQGYTAARKYLTTGAAASWHPESGIDVYEEGSPSVSGVGDVVLRTRLVGQVDTGGAFTQVSTPLVHDFELVKEEGEWRISHPSRGVLVSDYLFRNAYRMADLYFLSRQADVLVPDTVVVPRGARELRPIVERVLSGPSAWLAPAVRATLPQDSGVAAVSVDVDSGSIANVHLSDSVSALDADARSALAAQLTWTLAGFDQVEGVRMFAGDMQMTIAEADRDGVLRTSALVRFSPVSDAVSRQLFGMRDRALVRANEDSGELKTTSLGWQPAAATSLAVDAQAATAAVVVGGRDVWIGKADGGPSQRIRSADGMIRPQYARDGALWTYGGSFSAWQNGKAVPIVAPELAGQSVVAFRIAPDGARIAVILGSGDASKLAVMRVVRSDGTIRLSGLTVLDIGDALRPRDVAWLGASTLAVSYEAAGSGVVTTDIAGAMVTDQNLPSSRLGAVLASSARETDPDLVACDSTGRCSRYVSDQRWTVLSGSLMQPTYPA